MTFLSASGAARISGLMSSLLTFHCCAFSAGSGWAANTRLLAQGECYGSNYFLHFLLSSCYLSMRKHNRENLTLFVLKAHTVTITEIVSIKLIA